MTAAIFAFDNLLGALFPDWWVMQRAWELLLPDFTFGKWGAFFIGPVESFAGGFLTAVVFVPVFDFLSGRSGSAAAGKACRNGAAQRFRRPGRSAVGGWRRSQDGQ